jgi:serine phosphatase RsbU (regulator of sigma subunit)
VSGLGGDLYDWHSRAGGAHFLVADAMGHGIAAAIMATNLRAAIRAVVSVIARQFDATTAGGPAGSVDGLGDRIDRSLGDIVGLAASTLAEYLDRADMFITLFAARLLPDGRVFTVDAGHGLTVLVRADGSWQHLPATGLPIGIAADTSWTVDEHRLRPGDAMLTVTDGALELFDGTLASLPELVAIVRSDPDPQRWVDELMARAEATRPAPDDVTVVAVRRER